MNPILSIVIATLDCAEDIEACLNSAQRVFSACKKNEYEIIIKDGSKDASVFEIIKKHQSSLSLKYYHQEDSGIYEAWNQALNYCNGKWIYFLGADDEFVDDFQLNELKPALKKLDFPIISIPVIYIYGKTTRIATIDKKNFLKKICHSNPFHHQGIFHRADILKEIGFDSRFRVSGDFDMLLKITKANPELIISLDTKPLTRMHSGGISSRIDTNLLRLKERAKARANNSIPTNYPIVISSYLAAYIKISLSLFIDEKKITNIYFKTKSALKITK